MGRLLASGICSADGYTVDAAGRFDWAMPDEQLHAAVNDAERGVGTVIYGRRMWETMRVWQTLDTDDSPETADYQRIWRAAQKVVVSRTLPAPEEPRTRLERSFDPDAVRALVLAADHDVSIGGPTLAAAAFAAGLVEAVTLYVVPVAVGGGTPFFPPGARVDLALRDERRFDGGALMLRYDVRHDRG